MRINELNMFQNLLSKGQDAVSSLANQFRGTGAPVNQEKVDKMARDMFINKFVSRGAEALSTAVQQKLVDPNSTDMGGSNAKRKTKQPAGSGQAAPAGGQSGAQQPAAPAAPAAGSGQPAAPAAGSGQTAQPAAPAAAGQAAPAAGQATPGAATATAGSPGAKSKAPGNNAIPAGQKQGAAKPAIDVNVDKIVSGMRQLQPAGTKPLPPESKIAKEILADLPNVSLNKDYLIRVGDKILKLDNAGYDVKDLHRQFMGQYAKGNKQKTIQESIHESRLEEIAHKLRSSERMQNALKKAGYDPELAIRRMEDLLAKRRKAAAQRDDLIDLDEVSPQGGGRVAGAGLSQTPNAIRKRQARAAQKAARPAAPGAAQAAPATGAPAAPAQGGQQAPSSPGKPSMGKWLKDNFITTFFKNVPWQSAEPQIDDILKTLPQAFAKGNVKKELTDIASIGWSLSPKRDERY
jgi:hypothetical protein